MTADDEPVVVAIIDAPDRDHPQLAGRILDGVDLRDGEGAPGWSHPTAHGTAVAGKVLETAPEAAILPIEVGPDASSKDLAQAVDHAREAGVDVLNISVAVASDHEDLREAVRQTAQAGVLVIAGTGNTGADDEQCAEFADPAMPTGQVLYPAAYPETVAVGGLDTDGRVWSCSVAGAHVDLLAPAVDLDLLGLHDERPHRVGSGTSYAAPQVAGAAALLLQRHPELTSAQVERLLRRHGEAMSLIGDRPEPRRFDLAVLLESAQVVVDGDWAIRADELPGGCIGEPAEGAVVSVDDGTGVVSVTVDASGFDPRHNVVAYQGPAWSGGGIRVRYEAHGPLGFANDEDAFGSRTQMWGEMALWLGTSTDPADYTLEHGEFGWYLDGPLVEWAGPERPVLVAIDDGDRHLVGEDAEAWSAMVSTRAMRHSCSEDEVLIYRPDDAWALAPDWIAMKELTLAHQRAGELAVTNLNGCKVEPGTYALVVAPEPRLWRWVVGDGEEPSVQWWEQGSFAEVEIREPLDVEDGCEDDDLVAGAPAGDTGRAPAGSAGGGIGWLVVAGLAAVGGAGAWHLRGRRPG